MDVGGNLKRIRKDKQMTITELSERSGVSQTHISLTEKGVRCLSLQSGKAVADALGCTINDLIADEKDAG